MSHSLSLRGCENADRNQEEEKIVIQHEEKDREEEKRGGGGEEGEKEGDSKVARGPRTVASFLPESPQIRGKGGLRQLGDKQWMMRTNNG